MAGLPRVRVAFPAPEPSSHVVVVVQEATTGRGFLWGAAASGCGGGLMAPEAVAARGVRHDRTAASSNPTTREEDTSWCGLWWPRELLFWLLSLASRVSPSGRRARGERGDAGCTMWVVGDDEEEETCRPSACRLFGPLSRSTATVAEEGDGRGCGHNRCGFPSSVVARAVRKGKDVFGRLSSSFVNGSIMEEEAAEGCDAVWHVFTRCGRMLPEVGLKSRVEAVEGEE